MEVYTAAEAQGAELDRTTAESSTSLIAQRELEAALELALANDTPPPKEARTTAGSSTTTITESDLEAALDLALANNTSSSD